MRFLNVFGLRKSPVSAAESRLRTGVPGLAEILGRHGFRFFFRGSGTSSGGAFAYGEFVRGDRRLEFHVRSKMLGLVRYHLRTHSASHEFYMKELGVFPQCQYPGSLRDPLDAFVRLAHDLGFAGEFLSGDAHVLLRASQRELEYDTERDERESQRYAGDVRLLQQMRCAFRDGAYDEVVHLARTLRFPEKMTIVERRMMDIAKSRAGSG